MQVQLQILSALARSLHRLKRHNADSSPYIERRRQYIKKRVGGYQNYKIDYVLHRRVMRHDAQIRLCTHVEGMGRHTTPVLERTSGIGTTATDQTPIVSRHEPSHQKSRTRLANKTVLFSWTRLGHFLGYIYTSRKKWNRLGKNRCERHSAMVARGDQSGTEAKPNESRCKWLQ